ncbi:MAG TPA: pitrilysin family protein [Gemmatimonadaceae bacterium]|nr:pitrilysin family protein [Gemmatimonadaceae bacterium]
MITRVDTRPTQALRRSILPNGLTVLSETMPGVRSVAFGAWVRSASIHESRDRMGVSHMLEHMVFKGTRKRSPRDIALALEVLGGSLDAYTAREHTSFQARVLDEHLPQAADVIADLMFSPALRAADLSLERKVVLEEISMVDDTPDDLVFELHNEALWGLHPYGYSILGTRDTVSALSIADLRDLHAQAYQPEHIVVTVSGNVDHDELLDILGRTGWADVPRGDTLPSATAAPVAAPPRTVHVERDTTQAHIVFGSPAVAHGDRRRYAMLLVSMLLGGGMSSRLFQRVREELGLAYSVYTFQSFHADTGVHGVYVGTSPSNATAAADAIRSELRVLAEQGIPEPELAAGKSQLKGQLTLSLESVSSRMYRAAAVELYREPYKPLDELLAEIDRIDASTVADLCREFFAPDAQTVLTLGPAASAH